MNHVHMIEVQGLPFYPELELSADQRTTIRQIYGFLIALGQHTPAATLKEQFPLLID